MAIRNTNSFDFSDVVKEYLRYYDGLTVEALTTVIPQVAKESVQKLKATSPEGPDGYARNWKMKYEKGRIKGVATVYGGKPTYRLAHLLEYGHLTRNGKDRVRAIEHIKPVEEWAVKESVNRFIDYMEEHITS